MEERICERGELTTRFSFFCWTFSSAISCKFSWTSSQINQNQRIKRVDIEIVYWNWSCNHTAKQNRDNTQLLEQQRQYRRFSSISPNPKSPNSEMQLFCGNKSIPPISNYIAYSPRTLSDIGLLSLLNTPSMQN